MDFLAATFALRHPVQDSMNGKILVQCHSSEGAPCPATEIIDAAEKGGNNFHQKRLRKSSNPGEHVHTCIRPHRCANIVY